MYTSHFRLKEAPFSITPDPRYLYMSERHREALAHLLYGVGQGGGFVQLTGEVGTGKTTLCRCLLEQVPSNVDVALILNPRLTSLELLATVCDELRIPYPPGTTSLKVLIDALQRYLLDACARGRRTVLIIDEAQNLSADVLEQIRLLTNLETTTEKLLQIILIGQPELIALLERRRLRQLAQRVTARYHLRPLSAADTRAYIRHRLSVAGLDEAIFSGAATRLVHRLSGGVPRLINVICDRALLGAYARDKRGIDAATVRQAAREVLDPMAAAPGARPVVWTFSTAITAAAIIGVWVLMGGEHGADRRQGARALTQDVRPPSAIVPNAEPSGPAAVAERREARVALGEVLSDPAIASEKGSAFVNLLSRWGVDYDRTTGGLACERGRVAGLECLFRTGNWSRLRRFNLPAVIELIAPTGSRHYATVVGLGEQSVTLAFGGRRYDFARSEIDAYWDGAFITVWRPPAVSGVVISPGMRGTDVDWLRERMERIDGQASVAGPPEVYDEQLRGRVVAFQRSRSLVADGVVGVETLTHLTSAVDDPSIPLLSRRTP